MNNLYKGSTASASYPHEPQQYRGYYTLAKDLAEAAAILQQAASKNDQQIHTVTLVKGLFVQKGD